MSPLLVLSSSTACCSSEKSSSSCTFFAFPASSAYLNPFQHWLYDFEIHLLTLRTIEGITITKGENMYWCSRRTHNALRDGGCKLFKLDDQGKLYLFCLLKSSTKWKNMIVKQMRRIYTSSSCSKVYIPRLLMHCVAFLSISKCFHLL